MKPPSEIGPVRPSSKTTGPGGLSVRAPLFDYNTALSLQQKIVAAKIDKSLDRDVLLLLEHPPVFTLGRRGGRENLLVSDDFLKKRGIRVIRTERGGNITYHAPGQLTAYPIVNLKAARLGAASFVEALEEIMIRLCAEFGATARRQPETRGVWTKNGKLGSVGVAVRRGISFHGLALNVNLSLEPFGWINPCGLENIKTTSLGRELGEKIPMPKIYESAARLFQKIIGIDFEPTDFLKLKSTLSYVENARRGKTPLARQKTAGRSRI